MAKLRPWHDTPEEWERLLRDRKRADHAISTGTYLKFIAFWGFLMLLAHLNGRW